MKAIILYDLAAPVEMSPEDAEVVALVNRGRSPDDRLVVAYGPGIYLVPRSISIRERMIRNWQILLMLIRTRFSVFLRKMA